MFNFKTEIQDIENNVLTNYSKQNVTRLLLLHFSNSINSPPFISPDLIYRPSHGIIIATAHLTEDKLVSTLILWNVKLGKFCNNPQHDKVPSQVQSYQEIMRQLIDNKIN